MTSLRQTIPGARRYRGGEQLLSYWEHRISGLGTLLFLAVHILNTSIVYFIPRPIPRGHKPVAYERHDAWCDGAGGGAGHRPRRKLSRRLTAYAKTMLLQAGQRVSLIGEDLGVVEPLIEKVVCSCNDLSGDCLSVP